MADVSVWKELIKLLDASHKAAAAVCLTTSALLWGPRYAPSLFVSRYWIHWQDDQTLYMPVVALFFLSSSFVAMSVAKVIATAEIWDRMAARLRGGPTSTDERLIVTLLASGGSAPRKLEQMSEVTGRSMLHLEHAADSLEAKGLLDRNPYDANLVSLTARGRGVAIRGISVLGRIVDARNRGEPRP